MIVLALVVVGASSYLGLGVDRLPRVEFPQVNVRTLLPGAAVEEVETQVSEPIEEAVRWGMAAGAAAAMTPGTAAARRSDVERLYRQAAAAG